MIKNGEIITASPAVAEVRSGKDYPISPKTAWKLWEQIHILADSLWEAYEYEFLDFCSVECGNTEPAPATDLQE